MPTIPERVDRLEQHQAGERADRMASDAEHTARITALEGKVERGFADTRADAQDTRSDIRDLRALVLRLVWIVGGLYSLMRWGPGVAKDMEQALAPVPSPVPIVRRVEASPSPTPFPVAYPSAAPTLVDARP